MADETRRLIRVRMNKGARFKRDGFGKKPQISDSWRKPRGQHNKQRRQKKAKGNLPKPGFGSPIDVRGMHPSGFFEVLVHSGDDLEGLDPRTQAVRIAATVGNRKRSIIQEKAISAGLKVLNAKAPKPVTRQGEPEPAEEKAKESAPKKTQEKMSKKPAAVKKKAEPPKVKEEVKKDTKPSSQKKKPEKAAEPEQQLPKETKQKVSKPKAETVTEIKTKKTPKAKAEPAKESKPAKKTTSKPTGKSKKKTEIERGGEEQ
ncbi:MAG: 50S ribosomal protein L32e [Methanoregula sp. PtaU1.Bin051]|nr:MAG: 50S ribosomal protein L32e [Methanoregula sp. PtaU1.Bin051]